MLNYYGIDIGDLQNDKLFDEIFDLEAEEVMTVKDTLTDLMILYYLSKS